MYSKVCALTSGGIESALMLDALLRSGARVRPLYVRSGYRWEPAELAHLRRYLAAVGAPRLEPLIVLESPVRDLLPAGHWSLSGRGTPGARSRDEAVQLAGRNVLLLAKAAVYAAREGAGAVALGLLATNPFPDGGRAFLRRMAAALSTGLGRPLEVLAPFSGRRKESVLRAGAGLPLGLTFSCISPARGAHCGRCNKCAERRGAFRRSGVADPTLYRFNRSGTARPGARRA